MIGAVTDPIRDVHGWHTAQQISETTQVLFQGTVMPAARYIIMMNMGGCTMVLDMAAEIILQHGVLYDSHLPGIVSWNLSISGLLMLICPMKLWYLII